MKRFCTAFVVLLTLLSLQTANAQSGAPRDKDFDLGLSAGVLFPGSLWVSAADDYILTNVSPLIRVNFDAYLIPKLTMGLYVNLGFVGLDKFDQSGIAVPSSYNSATMFEFGGAISPVFRAKNVQIKPALNLGYRIMHLNTDQSVNIQDTKGLGVNADVQVMLLTGGVVNPYFELGFLAQPAGGNKDTDLTFAPIIYLTVGASI